LFLLESFLMQLASSVVLFTCNGAVPKSSWALGVVLAGLLVVGLPTRAVGTTLDSGTTTVSSGTNLGYLTVGNTGTATLEVIAGGYATSSVGFLGYYAGSDGTATVSSGTWAASANLVVGIYGNGTLNVTGGSVTSSFGFIGSEAGSVGTATVSSGTWANGVDLNVGNSGIGTLTMSGGLVSVGGTLSKNGNGTINLNSGGSLQIGVGGGSGILNVSTLTNNGTLIFNRSDASTYSGIISGTGSVTKQGGGTLTLSGNNSYTGGTTIRSGSVAVAVGGVISHGNANLIIGQSSGDSGALNVNGGSVTNFVGTLGENAGGVGTATVSSGTWATSTTLSVGGGGTGTLDVNGGSVTSSISTIGEVAGSVGTATVSSGTWATSTTLFVGGGGTGTLDVNGGSVTSNLVSIGNLAGGVGTATVSSGTWANSSALVVGRSGTGTLNVTGGYVGNASGILGFFAGSTGTATVSSGTWAIGGNLVVGSSGTGTLTMSGGLVSVAGTLSKGGNGTINLNSGGTLQIGTGGTTGVLLGGTASLVNDGSLIFNRSDASTYSGVLSGSGTVTKQGAGLLTFGGVNSHSGLTTISAGTVALSGTGSIGTGGLNLGTIGSPGVFDLLGVTAGTYSLPSSASLAGVGTISGSGKSLAVLGSLAPGNSVGTITVGSGLSLDLSNSVSSVFEITDPTFTASTYDLISGDGRVVFGGILNLAFSGGSYADGTDVLQLFPNTGGRSGNFSAVNASGLAAGQSATFNSATGFITVVPEPSTCAMALAGLACGGYSMYRRRKQA
jgi:fibronectin-binding autotransporter adhesin